MVTAEDFWRRVHVRGPDECWPWKTKVKQGYGRLRVNGKNVRGHRYAFFLEHAHWPTPCCCHSCDNPPCCNPAHLFEGTQAQNLADMNAKGRQVSPKGDRSGARLHPQAMARQRERNGRAKLTVEQVTLMRELRATGNWTQSALGRKFGVAQQLVSRIVEGKAWA